MPEKVGYLMYKTNTSLNKLGGAKIFGWFFLLIAILSGGTVSSKELEKPDLSKPFKKCWEYSIKNERSLAVASDNELQLIISNGNSLISIDPITKLENWKSEISGELIPKTISDKESLFFITMFESKNDPELDYKEKREENITFNSISLKTGITKWQQKISRNQQLEIKSIYHKDIIFITDDNKTLFAIQKKDGVMRWKKGFSSLISSLEVALPMDIKVLTGNHLFRLNAETGVVLEEIKVGDNSAKNFIIKEDYIITGDAVGNVTKFITEKGKSGISWKVKTGGSISNLISLEEDILVTSLDNFLYLFSSEKGKLKWKRRLNGRISLRPLMFDNYAVVVNSSDNIAIIVDLRDGKVVNQIQIEDENYFSASPLILRNFLIFQTLKGIYFFSNTDVSCS